MTAPARPVAQLLPAQKRMLQLAADGATDREIAHQLKVPISTIRSQWRYHLRPALGGIDRTHTIALAVAAGLAHPTPKERVA